MSNESHSGIGELNLNSLDEEEGFIHRRQQYPIDIVDLCTPPTASRHNTTTGNAIQSSTDPDVEIVGIQQLTRRPFVGRRINIAESNNIFYDNEHLYSGLATSGPNSLLDDNESLELDLDIAESYGLFDDNEHFELGETPITASTVQLVSAAPEQMFSPIRDDSSYKCPICLQCVKSRSPVATKCGHVFCNDCITAVLNISPLCALCKTQISSRDLRRIFL